MANIPINLTYPNNDKFDVETHLTRINLDRERELDLLNDNGFIISDSQGIKKDLKDPDGIFSSRYGQGLGDLNPFADRYKCDCGHTTSRINNGMTCKICGTKVRYVDDNFKLFGWKVLKNYYIIHPNLYKTIEFLIGKDFINIINFEKKISEDGHVQSEAVDKPVNQPYYGIGLREFKERFDEIMNFYLAKNPGKIEYYNDLMENKDKIFTQSVPFFTTHLRPYEIDRDSFYFEDSNAKYTVINKLISQLNDNETKGSKEPRPVDSLLFDLQKKYMELYTDIEQILSGKKGVIRSLFGGRYNFTSRNVIVAGPHLRIDEITLPYKCLIVLLEQSIINILSKSYSLSYNDAYNMWYKAHIKEDETIKKIIMSIIKSKPRGLEIIINRNPTIQYGGILQMFCVGMTDTYTMAVPLQVLDMLAADFDGDVLNILYIINKEFFERAYAIFNPRNSMYISRNDGRFNNSVNHQKDTIINSNTLIRMGRKYYTSEELQAIQKIIH